MVHSCILDKGVEVISILIVVTCAIQAMVCLELGDSYKEIVAELGHPSRTESTHIDVRTERYSRQKHLARAAWYFAREQDTSQCEIIFSHNSYTGEDNFYCFMINVWTKDRRNHVIGGYTKDSNIHNWVGILKFEDKCWITKHLIEGKIIWHNINSRLPYQR